MSHESDGLMAEDPTQKQVKSVELKDECCICNEVFSADNFGQLDEHVLNNHAEIMIGKEDDHSSLPCNPPSFLKCQDELNRSAIQTDSIIEDSSNNCEKLPTMCNLNSHSVAVLLRGMNNTSHHFAGHNLAVQVNAGQGKAQETHVRPIFKCTVCPSISNSARGMARHMIRWHSNCAMNETNLQDGTDKFKCPKCPMTCTSLTKLIAHYTVLHVNSNYRTFSCTECNFKTISSDSLERHILRKHHKNKAMHSFTVKVYRCPECPRILKSKSELIVHSRVHTGERPYPCNECSYRAKQKRHLMGHIKNIHQKDKSAAVQKPKKRYHCPDCSLVFNTAGRFLEHNRTHTGDKLFNCSVCNHKCRTNGDLKVHMMLHQDDIGDTKFESRSLRNCPHCPYKNFSLLKLTEHMKLHDGEHPFECNQCEYKAKSEEHLKYHKTIHQNGKLFKCSECEYGTNSENAFSHHMEDHTGEQKYACQDCSRTFKYKLQLTRHMANAHNVKPFKCLEPDCGFATATKFSLINHTKLHQGEPSQACAECENKFHTMSQLYKHEAIHYGKGPFKCPDCSFVSIHRTSIRRHRKEGGRGYTCVVITRSETDTV